MDGSSMNIGGKVLQKNGSGTTQINYGWEMIL